MVTTVQSIVEDHDIDQKTNSETIHLKRLTRHRWGKMDNGSIARISNGIYDRAILSDIWNFRLFDINIVISILLMIVLFELCSRHVTYASAFMAPF